MQNSNEHIDYDLLTKHLLGESSAVEDIQIKQWLEADPKNAEVLNELRAVLDLVDDNNDAPEVNIDAAWKKMQERMSSVASTKVVAIEQAEKKPSWGKLGIAAAIVGFVALIGVVLKMNINNTSGQMIALSSGTEILTDTLPDGTIITLNKNSELLYAEAFVGETREVRLIGEAFFDVARDESRPFLINTSEIDVTVLGTSFNVRAYADKDIEVAVRTGKVKVDDRTTADPLILLPGKKAAFARATKELKEVTSKGEEEFWHLRKLVFYNTTLAEVVGVLNEHYGATIEIENVEAEQCRFTSTFDDNSLEEVLAVLTATFDLKLTESDGKQLLKGSACNVATP